MLIRQFCTIQAEPAEVWQALTDPQLTSKYMFGCQAISEWRIGDTLDWRGKDDGIVYVTGKVKAIDPPNVLAYTVFDPNGPYADVEENYLLTTIIIKSTDEGTIVEVIQGDFSKVENGKQRFEKTQESWTMTLDGLRQTAEEISQ